MPEPGPGRVKQCIDNGAGVLRFPTWGSRQAGANGLSQAIEHCLALKNTKYFFKTIIGTSENTQGVNTEHGSFDL